MSPARSIDPQTIIVRIPMSESDCLRVALGTDKGRVLVDLRVFSRRTPARVMMPTRHAIAVAPALLPELVQALQAVQHAVEAMP